MQDSRELLIAWLHDPPDKPLDIRGHVGRACRYLSAALAAPVDSSDLQGHHADQLASATERLPMPKWDADPAALVGADQVQLIHPLAPSRVIRSPDGASEPVREEEVQQAIAELVDGVEDPSSRFLALWRQLPERLAGSRPLYGRLPADTRVPDHTVWQHLDTTAGIHTVLADPHGGAFLCFSLGPVQSFIATARTVRDLWTGSMILSWLTFRAMLPIIEQLGPTAMVYPSLRGIPLLDLWLNRRKALRGKVKQPDETASKSPCIPNRFVAMVPWGEAGGRAARLADDCRAAAAGAWHELADAVHDELARKLTGECPDWDRHWNAQVDGFFDLRTSLVPWRECDDKALASLLTASGDFDTAFPDAADVRKLEKAIPKAHQVGYSQRSAGQWQFRLELSARALEADKAIRQVQPPAQFAPGELVPAKCSMMGTIEQMGPADMGDAATFWQKATANARVGGARVRTGERLSAVALVKRFAGPAKLAGELQLKDVRTLRFDDTATIAAAGWLKNAREKGFHLLDPEQARKDHDDWSGQWLHAAKLRSENDATDDAPCPSEVWEQIRDARKHPELGPPPAYYAVLVMDGDNLGEWLSGKRSPRVREVLHPQLLRYFERFEAARPGLDARRPVTPALHAAISEALANFALYFVPEIVQRHQGTLIYAGGDDVLALLPTASAIRCAAELQETYRKPWHTDRSGRVRVLMGKRATLSAGLAIVHHKEDLRFALQAARDAEKRVKHAERDALQIVACRRSGEHASALCPWPFVATVDHWVKAFERAASDRWAYHVRASLPTLRALKPEAMEAELRRQLNRAERPTRELFDPSGNGERAGDELAAAFRTYRSFTDPEGAPRFDHPGNALEGFITLCQTASFLARGRDA